MDASRRVVVDILRKGQVVYGINTGFGRLSDVTIPNDQLAQLQLNLVRSHCCGVGPLLAAEEVRAMLVLRANVLAKGRSGARADVAEALLDMLRADVLPEVPSRGSVGASGDLAPLAHLALGAVGEGFCWYRGCRMHAREALAEAGLVPLQLEAKEGLALLNGTQAIVAVGGLALNRSKRALEAACVAGALTLEALLGTPTAMHPQIHAARPHVGQIRIADLILGLLNDSQIRESHRTGDKRVQDAYALRCMPQVHGAVLGVLEHVGSVLELETGSATDNPLVFAETGDVLSGGNFHGAPLSYALDYAAIAMTDLISICERRVDRLVNPDSNEGLPPFLARKPGISSGLMIAHVSIAALLNEAKVLAHPASSDSVPTSGGKEDHVSMGMTAALKFKRIVELAEIAIAIELMAAAEGIEHRRPLRSSESLERAHAMIRTHVEPLIEDRVLSADIETLSQNLDGIVAATGIRL